MLKKYFRQITSLCLLALAVANLVRVSDVSPVAKPGAASPQSSVSDKKVNEKAATAKDERGDWTAFSG